MSRERRPPRLLKVLAHDLTGGTELLVLALADRLNREGLSTDVVTLDSPGPVARELRERGVEVRSLGNVARAVGGLPGILRAGGYGLVEGYGFKASMLVRFAARAARPRPVVVCGVMGAHVTEVVDLDEPKGRFALALERATHRLVDAYDVISLAAIERLTAAGVPRGRQHYIPNGIDLSHWRPRPEQPSDEIPTLLCSARFVPRKRQEDLVRALAVLRRPVILELAGTGPTLGAVRELAGEVGVADRVRFLGDVPADEVRRHLEAASAFCLPSLWEGMPAAVLEAMASCVPVITTDVEGNRELVEHGVTGLLVPARNPDELAAAMERVLSDPGGAATMAARAREEVERRYSLDVMVAARRALYEQLLRSR